MKSSLRIAPTLIIFSLLISACAPTEQQEVAKVEIDQGILREQGLQPYVEENINPLSALGFGSSLRRVKLQAGTQLVATLDTRCVSEARSGLAREITSYTQDKPILGTQAYGFQLTNMLDLAEFTLEAQNDPCVIQIGNEVQVHTISVPNDPNYSQQWYLDAVAAPTALDTFFGSKGIANSVTIAVVDSGVDYNHSDLKANMWTNSKGFYGYDFVNRDNFPLDDNGHGTHVAGISAGVRNNGIGISGVMGSKVKIMAVKSMGRNGDGSTASVVNGINYAVENGADVINISLGHLGSNSAMKQALKNAVNRGITVLVAAGNDNRKLTLTQIFSPASYAAEIKGVVSVGSFTSSGSRSGFSNYGPDYVEIGAPGSNIYSTYLNGSYTYLNGTSMATPVVSGAAGLTIGLLKARGVRVTPAIVEDLLLTSATKSSGLSTAFKDGNRLNLENLATLVSGKNP